MSEPIKVSRARWDEWFVRFCDDVRPLPSTIYDSDEMDLLRERFARIVGCPRPAPDTPPDLTCGSEQDVTIAFIHDGHVRVDARPIDRAQRRLRRDGRRLVHRLRPRGAERSA